MGVLGKKGTPSWTYYADEAVYGANDGIITTFAIVSGATGGALAPEVVVVLGLANLVADGFSMGASSFLSIRTKEDIDRRTRWFRRKKNNHASARSLVTFCAFVLAGAIPLIPFLVRDGTGHMFLISTIGAAAMFFVVGGLRTIATKRGFFTSGLEMLTIGGVAACLAYFVGYVARAVLV